MKGERRKEGKEKRKGRKEGRNEYVCSCVCNCKTEHATVGLLACWPCFSKNWIEPVQGNTRVDWS